MREVRQPKRSDLFLVRIWVSESTGGETEWRGKVQRSVSGEARYFYDLPELADILRSMMTGQGRTERRAGRGDTGIADTHDANG